MKPVIFFLDVHVIIGVFTLNWKVVELCPDVRAESGVLQYRIPQIIDIYNLWTHSQTYSANYKLQINVKAEKVENRKGTFMRPRQKCLGQKIPVKFALHRLLKAHLHYVPYGAFCI